MAEIPGPIFIILGVIIAVASFIINRMGKTNRMVVFIIAGALMVAWGAIKIMTNPKARPKEKPKHEAKAFCSRCGSVLKTFDNFCPRCGQKVFRR